MVEHASLMNVCPLPEVSQDIGNSVLSYESFPTGFDSSLDLIRPSANEPILLALVDNDMRAPSIVDTQMFQNLLLLSEGCLGSESESESEPLVNHQQHYFDSIQLESWVDSAPVGERSDRKKARRAICNARNGQVKLSGLQISCLPFGLNLKSLTLNRCPSVRSLPDDIKIKQDLSICNCQSFSSLPGVQLSGDLDLFKLPLFDEWYKNSIIEGNLSIKDCSVITTLPDQLTVGKNVRFQSCAVLRSLSEHLRVGGNLSIQDCDNFSSFPFRSVFIGEDLHLENLPFMLEFPSWINSLNVHHRARHLRRVNLINIAVPVHEQLELRRMLTNVDVHIENPEYVPYGTDLVDVVQHWLDLSEQTYAGEAQKLANELPQSRDLVAFLQRLEGTKEFQVDPRTLSRRVSKLLNNLVENKIPQEEALAIIYNMLSSCNDGIIQALQDLEILSLIKSALDCPMPKVMLYGLGEDLMKLEVIKTAAFDIAAQQRARGQDPDEVEIYLRLETTLAGPLALPTNNHHMIFSARSFLTHADIAATEEKVWAHIASPEAKKIFFEQWDPWQNLLRKEAVEAFEKVGHRSIAMRPEYVEAQCPLSLEFGEDLEDPVTIDKQSGVFELDELLKWYQEDGRHPVTHKPFTLDDIVLIRKGFSM